MKCPRDSSALEPKIYEAKIEIDACAHCGGMWLDKGELEAIQETSRARLPATLGNVSDTVKRSINEVAQMDTRPSTAPSATARWRPANTATARRSSSTPALRAAACGSTPGRSRRSRSSSRARSGGRGGHPAALPAVGQPARAVRRQEESSAQKCSDGPTISASPCRRSSRPLRAGAGAARRSFPPLGA